MKPVSRKDAKTQSVVVKLVKKVDSYLYHFFIKMRPRPPVQTGFVSVAPAEQAEGDIAQLHTEMVLDMAIAKLR